MQAAHSHCPSLMILFQSVFVGRNRWYRDEDKRRGCYWIGNQRWYFFFVLACTHTPTKRHIPPPPIYYRPAFPRPPAFSLRTHPYPFRGHPFSNFPQPCFPACFHATHSDPPMPNPFLRNRSDRHLTHQPHVFFSLSHFLLLVFFVCNVLPLPSSISSGEMCAGFTEPDDAAAPKRYAGPFHCLR